jgi:hypothetical protein
VAAFLADTLGGAARLSRDGVVHFVCMDWRHMDSVSAADRPRDPVKPLAPVRRRRATDCGFEPVSAETQPVSGRLPIQISDIEKSSSRDLL